MLVYEGKRYIRRDGTVSPPLVVDHYEEYLVDPETKWEFERPEQESEEGNLVYPGEEHPHDLMEEYKE